MTTEHVWIGCEIDLHQWEVILKISSVDPDRPFRSEVALTMEQFARQGTWLIEMFTETYNRARAMIELKADDADIAEMEQAMRDLNDEWLQRRAK